jgi:hypothetical protein
MPTKLLNTKAPAKPPKRKGPAKIPTKEAAAPKVKRGGDPWLRDTRRDEVAEEPDGMNWLPREKSRNWLKRNR